MTLPGAYGGSGADTLNVNRLVGQEELGEGVRRRWRNASCVWR